MGTSGPLYEFVAAFRAGDLDLPFPFRDADRHTALAASEKRVGLPLIPLLPEQLRVTLDPVNDLQIFQPFI